MTRAGVAVGAGLVLLLVLTLPVTSLLVRDGAVQLDATASGLWALIGERLGVGALRPGLVLATLAAAALVLLLSARARPLLLVAVPALFLVNAAVVWDARIDAARDTVFAPSGTRVDWIDRAVPQGADVATLFAPSPVAVVDGMRLSEFFGTSVGLALGVDGATYTPSAPVVDVRLAADGHVVAATGDPVEVGWVLAAPALGPLAGRRVGTGTSGGVVLWEVEQPLRLGRARP